MPKIDLPAFNGPLDLLLHLIERQELDITAISLSQVTAQYLEQVELLKSEQRIEQLMDFLVIAARLVQIKSRAILPQTPASYLDDELEEDPAEALIRQLKTYKQFKQAATWLQGRQTAVYRTYLRLAPPPKVESKLDTSGVTVDVLITAVRDALARLDDIDKSVTIARPRRLTIEDQIKRLRRLVKQPDPFTFNDLLSSKADMTEISVSLLATLELIKRRELRASQSQMFGEIEIVGN